MTGQTLMIDADDTLWENNIYFEQAIAGFISYLDHRTHTPVEVREHLNRVEHTRVKLHGYGMKSFQNSLLACFEELSDAPPTVQQSRQIESFAQSIHREEMELLPGVEATLAQLNTRHRILLVTKGDEAEQTGKLNRSGLAPYFHHVEVLPEKHLDAYQKLRDRHACESQTTWMIGNSPRSDINPALAAGLNAVFIPHTSTWVLEHDQIAAPLQDRQLLHIENFTQLAGLF